MFSVVVPVYNHERYLEQALLSALSSRLVGEILVVDDGSADRSPEMLRRLSRGFAPRIVDLTVKGEGNKGAHYRLNQLIEAARGEWIAVLNSDDEFVSSRFDVLRSLIRANRSDFISGALLIQDHVGGLIGTKQGIASPEYPLSIRFNDTSTLFTSEMLVLLCNQNFIATTSNMTFRTSLFRRVGGFRDFRYVHDWDFALARPVSAFLRTTHSQYIVRTWPIRSRRRRPMQTARLCVSLRIFWTISQRWRATRGSAQRSAKIATSANTGSRFDHLSRQQADNRPVLSSTRALLRRRASHRTRNYGPLPRKGSCCIFPFTGGAYLPALSITQLWHCQSQDMISFSSRNLLRNLQLSRSQVCPTTS